MMNRTIRFQCVVILLTASAALSGCGAVGGGTGISFKATLDYIRQNGLPSFASLFPALPSQFSTVDGVNTDASGLPGTPSNLDSSVIALTGSGFSGLLSEARVLSTQGFSEARRFEALVQGLVSPVFEMTGQKKLFVEQTGDANRNSSGFAADDALALQGGDDSAEVNIFDQLLGELAFSVNLGGTSPDIPSHLVFSAKPSSEFVTISGLWPDAAGGGFLSGVSLSLRLAASDDMEMIVSLAPQLARGIVKGWAGSSCAGDVWELRIAKKEALGSARVSALECPDAVNRVSSLEVGSGASGLAISGGFSQNFIGAKSGSIREFLGQRQGFVLQAAAAPDLKSVAAAGAVLSQSDMAGANQDSVDRFGVGQLMTDFVQSKYWKPRKDAVSGNFAPTSADLQNIAYWTCNAPIVAAGIQASVSGTSSLCGDEKLDAESMIQTMQGLRSELDDYSIASSVKQEVSTIVDILSVRNTLFVGADSQVTYKNAPNEGFAGLDTTRKSVSVPRLDDSAWRDNSLLALRPWSRDALPTGTFGVRLSSLNEFVSGKCAQIVGDAQEKSGTARNTAANCAK